MFNMIMIYASVTIFNFFVLILNPIIYYLRCRATSLMVIWLAYVRMQARSEALREARDYGRLPIGRVPAYFYVSLPMSSIANRAQCNCSLYSHIGAVASLW